MSDIHHTTSPVKYDYRNACTEHGLNKLKILYRLKFGDFCENYLLFILYFNIGQYKKTIEHRIIHNFKTNSNVRETFSLLQEIGGRSDSSLKLGTLFDCFTNIDWKIYHQQILDAFILQIGNVPFNKKLKYPTAYVIYKDFINNRIDDSHIPDKKDLLNYIFYQALLYTQLRTALYCLATKEQLMKDLDKSDLDYLRMDMSYICTFWYPKN